MVYLELHYLGHCSNLSFCFWGNYTAVAFSSAFCVMFFLLHLKNCGLVLICDLDMHLILESQRFFQRLLTWGNVQNLVPARQTWVQTLGSLPFSVGLMRILWDNPWNPCVVLIWTTAYGRQPVLGNLVKCVLRSPVLKTFKFLMKIITHSLKKKRAKEYRRLYKWKGVRPFPSPDLFPSGINSKLFLLLAPGVYLHFSS